MSQTALRGGVAHLDAIYRNGSGQLADAVTPQVDIIDPSGTIIDNNATPAHDATGRYSIDWPVPTDADIGGYTAHWTGTVDGFPVEADDVFTVRAAGSETIPGDGPGVCTAWATIADVCAPCNTYDFDPALLEDGLLAASNVLFDLTGRRWPGECVQTVYPCREASGPRAVLSDPWWQSNRHLRSYRNCQTLHLPAGPTAIESVTVDGLLLAAEDYELQGSDLVRLDGSSWPCCSGCGSTDADAFAVTYTFGSGPPIGGRMAAAAYGCQIALACDDATSGACKLPANVQSLVRQGVSVTMPDPTQLAQEGLTGLPEVDRWVASVLIGQRRRPATIIMPGGGRRRSPAFWPRWF